MVVFTLVATATVDKWGRKPLLILGALIMAVSMIALGFLFYSGHVGLAALIVVCIYIAGFLAVVGPGGVGAAGGDFPEQHSQQGHGHRRCRAVDCEPVRILDVQHSRQPLGTDCLVQPRLRVLALRAVRGLVAAAFVWKYVPETKGKTLEAMHDLWHVKAK
jgi:SP family xylose:H+ symportor-like MFS transporter